MKNFYLIEGENYLRIEELKNNKFFSGFVSVDFKKTQKLQNKSILIIPNSSEMKGMMESEGFKEFEDYLEEKYFEKKIVVFYGNCHMENLVEFFEGIEKFSEKYALYKIKAVCNIKDVSYFDLPVFCHCDVLIHQSIRKANRYGEEFASENIISKTKPGCRIIAVPNVYHLPMCFFPQYTEKQELKHRSGSTLFFRDQIIDDGLIHGKSVDNIIAIYRKEDLYSTSYLANAWNVFIGKVKKRETQWDIKVSNFLCENVGKTQLFYDPNHPTDKLIRYIAKELMHLLGVSVSESIIDNLTLKRMDTYEMPICQSVISYFGFPYDTSKELRKTGNKAYRQDMYLEQYICQYISELWQDRKIPIKVRVKSYAFHVYYKIRRCLDCAKKIITK